MDDDEDFNSAVLEGLLNFPFDFHEMNSKVLIPFEINESIDTHLLKWILISSTTQSPTILMEQNVIITWKINLFQRWLNKKIAIDYLSST